MRINSLDKMIMGWVAIAVTLISTSIALKAYVDFGGSVCAFMFTLIISAAMQLMLLGSMYLIIDALCNSKKKSADVQLPETIPKAELEAEPEDKEQEPVTEVETPTAVSTDMSVEDYEERNKEHRHVVDMMQAQLTDSILRYTEHSFAPFLELDQLQDMLEEVKAWCTNPHYKPREIELRHISDYSQRLKVLDMKHYIWNVGVRLGTKNGYTGEVRARFIKAMFPRLLEDNTISSLCNQTHDADRGHIVLDIPKPDSACFTTMNDAA